MGLSLDGHDWFIHWPLATDATFSQSHFHFPFVLLLPWMVLVKFPFTFQLDIYSVFNINYCEHFTPTVSVTHSLLEGAEPFHLSRLIESFRKLFPWSLSSLFAGEEGFDVYSSLPIRGLKLALRAETLCTGLLGPTPTGSLRLSVWVEFLHFSLVPWWNSQCCQSGNHILRTSVLICQAGSPGSRQGIRSVLSLFLWLGPVSPTVGQRMLLPRVY